MLLEYPRNSRSHPKTTGTPQLQSGVEKPLLSVQLPLNTLEVVGRPGNLRFHDLPDGGKKPGKTLGFFFPVFSKRV